MVGKNFLGDGQRDPQEHHKMEKNINLGAYLLASGWLYSSYGKARKFVNLIVKPFYDFCFLSALKY